MGIDTRVGLSKKVKFTFKDVSIREPLIYNMGQKYSIITSIESANINKFEGWVILTVTGTVNQMDKAFQWMVDQGVVVQMMLPLD